MNEALGNVGSTVIYTDPIEINVAEAQVRQTQLDGLRELVADIDAGQVDMLVVLGGTPVYNAPSDLKFDKARLDKVKLRVHLSMYKDETSELCHWHVPESHYLEAWSDARAYDGTVSIVQPLIQPLYNSQSAHEFLSAFSTQPGGKGYDIVRGFWQGQKIGTGGQGTGVGQPSPSPQSSTSSSPQTSPVVAPPAQDFESAWRRALHDGWIAGTAFQPKSGLSVATVGQN